MFFEKLTLGNKVRVGLFFAFAISFSIGLLAIFEMQSLNKRVSDVSLYYVPMLSTVMSMKQEVLEGHLVFQSYLDHGLDTDWQNSLAHVKSVRAYMHKFDSILESIKEPRFLRRENAFNLSDYLDKYEELMLAQKTLKDSLTNHEKSFVDVHTNLFSGLFVLRESFPAAFLSKPKMRVMRPKGIFTQNYMAIFLNTFLNSGRTYYEGRIDSDQRKFQETIDEVTSIERIVLNLESEYPQVKRSKEASAFKAAIHAYRVHLISSLELRRQMAYFIEEVEKLDREIADYIQDMLSRVFIHVNTMVDDIHQQTVSSRLIVVIELALASLFMLVFLMYLVNNINSIISTLISETVKIIHSIGDGDVDQRVDVDKANFEFRLILYGINEVLDVLYMSFKEIMDVTASLAKGDYRARVEKDYKGIFNTFKININHAAKVLYQDSEALKTSRGLYRLLAANIPSAQIILFSADGDLLIVEGGEFHTDPFLFSENLVGRNIYVDRNDPAYAYILPKMLESLELAFQGQKTSGHEISYPEKDIELRMNCVPIHDSQGEVIYALVLLVDIREEKRTQEEKELIQKQLAHASKLVTIGTLAAGMAHEINNPLTIIEGLTSILKKKIEELKEDESRDKGDDSSSLLEIISKQETALKRIENIVGGLTVYARADTEKVEKFDIHDCIKDTIGLCETIYAKDDITVIHDLKSDLTEALGNSGKFNQVLMNLLSNAYDAIVESKHKNGIIKISTYRENDLIMIKVFDSGPGISKDSMEMIFDPFYTTKEPGKGTGMGLAISYSIVSAMNGTISIDFKEEKGTSFLIKIPLCGVDKTVKEVSRKPSVYEKTRSKENVNSSSKALLLQNKSILVVDDELGIRELLSVYLEELGGRIEEAKNGKEALELLEKIRFDFVVTDIRMPIMNGPELIEVSRKRGIKVDFIISTGGALGEVFSVEDNQLLSELPLLKKPYSKESIIKIFTDLLQKKNTDA